MKNFDYFIKILERVIHEEDERTTIDDEEFEHC